MEERIVETDERSRSIFIRNLSTVHFYEPAVSSS